MIKLDPLWNYIYLQRLKNFINWNNEKLITPSPQLGIMNDPFAFTKIQGEQEGTNVHCNNVSNRFIDFF